MGSKAYEEIPSPPVAKYLSLLIRVTTIKPPDCCRSNSTAQAAGHLLQGICCVSCWMQEGFLVSRSLQAPEP